MHSSRLRAFVELVANCAVAAAAIAIIWRVVISPVMSPTAPKRSSPVEDVRARNISVTVDQSAQRGSVEASLVLIEFSDYECPFCGRHARETFSQIDKEFIERQEVQYVFRNYPLEIHKHATSAAEAAECAGVQGKYWEMHRALFARQAELAESVWKREGSAIGLDMPSFEECLAGVMSEKIRADMAEGRRLGVKATPTFFIGRKEAEGNVRLVSRISGAHPFEVFRDALQDAKQ